MRVLVLVLCLMNVFGISGQEQTPAYLIMESDYFAQIFVDSDSIRVRETYLSEYNLEEQELYSYANMRSFLAAEHITVDELIPTQDLVKFPELVKGLRIKFKDLALEFQVLEPSFYLSLEYHPEDNSYWLTDNNIKRFVLHNTPNFDVAVFYNFNDQATVMVYTSDAVIKAALADSDNRPQGVILTQEKMLFNNWPYHNVQGFESFKEEQKYGVRDRVKQTVVVPAIYDSIQLKNRIHLWDNGVFGAYDYQLNQELNMGYTSYAYDSFSGLLLYLDKYNMLYAMDANNQIEVKAGPNQEPDYNNPEFNLKQNMYSIVLGKNNTYLVGYKGQNNTPADTLKQHQDYLDVFFDSGNKQQYIARSNCLFAARSDGKFDFFFIHHDPLVRRLESNIERWKLVPNYIDHPDYYPSGAEIVLIKNGLSGFVSQRNFNYLFKDVLYAFGTFTRVQFANGTLGWMDAHGNYFIDSN